MQSCITMRIGTRVRLCTSRLGPVGESQSGMIVDVRDGDAVYGVILDGTKEAVLIPKDEIRPVKSRAALRRLAVRKVVAMYRQNPDKDWQQTGVDLLHDPDLEAYWEGRTQEECDDLVMGLVRFGEWSRGGDSR